MSTLDLTLKQILREIRNTKDSGSLIVFLNGDLGVGKTHFVKRLAEHLKIKETITSPTFLILKTYEIPNLEKLLVHIDFYRFKDNPSPAVLEDIAFFDYIDKDIIFIEWGEIVKPFLPEDLLKNSINIDIKKDEYGNRVYEIKK